MFSPYLYGRGNSLFYIDPNGLDVIPIQGSEIHGLLKLTAREASFGVFFGETSSISDFKATPDDIADIAAFQKHSPLGSSVISFLLPGKKASVIAESTSRIFKSIRYINPTMNMKNCGKCAIAVDDMLAGKPLKFASPSLYGMETTELEKHFGSSFSIQSMTKSEINSVMKNLGKGARGIVLGSRGKDRIGHVFNVVNNHGKVLFLDGQTGKKAKFKNRGYKSFHLMRTN